MIRQQLTNTEDIRRVRKKAPCTRPEILMIQKQFLEDEIFSETIFTGELLVIKFSMCSLCHNYVFLKFDDLTLIDVHFVTYTLYNGGMTSDSGFIYAILLQKLMFEN